ncbi:MAG: tRNA dihydrouridine synthase DusB [Tissierellia bacterium]|nr:tRNA dihydrouridine synthase DusB [Tissierellia bacterium]
MKIDKLEFKNNAVLAPLAGYSDLPFRLICQQFHAGLTHTEMISAKALSYNDKKSLQYLKSNSEEKNLAVQIFGSDPKIIGDIIERHLNELKYIKLIDINFGCPAPKIVKNNEGSALLKDMKLSDRIINEAVKKSKVPVTIKMRIGIESFKDYIGFAKMAENAGAKAITVHGRTREQYYKGRANKRAIKEIVESVNIPVIGNGDVFCAKDYFEMIDQTNCAGVAIARGAIGNPFIFEEIYCAINNLDYTKANGEKIFKTIKKQMLLGVDLKGEKRAVLEMRKHIQQYIKSMPGSAEIKNELNLYITANEVLKLLENYLL